MVLTYIFALNIRKNKTKKLLRLVSICLSALITEGTAVEGKSRKRSLFLYAEIKHVNISMFGKIQTNSCLGVRNFPQVFCLKPLADRGISVKSYP